MITTGPRLSIWALLLGAASVAACGASNTATPATPTAAAESAGDARCGDVALADTPIAHRLRRVIQAMDSGERGVIESVVAEDFAESFRRAVPLDAHVEVAQTVHRATGGVVLCRVEYQSDHEVAALLAARTGDDLRRVIIGVEPAAPHRISDVRVQPADAAALTAPLVRLDAAARGAIVEGVAANLGDYVFADVAAAMRDRILARAAQGAYDALDHPGPLARALTDDLRAVSRDKHLRVLYSAEPLPASLGQEREPTEAERAEHRKHAAAQGFGFAASKMRPDGIGYVDIRGFFPVEIARDAAAEAMNAIADADALIVDLRQNGGGDPALVAFVTSYLFGPEPVHLNDLYFRARDETNRFFTEAEVPGPRFGPDKPVFVLTSGYTFSGGEEFAYNLKNLRRATLVGETTGGGAHPVHPYRIGDHTALILPVGRAINPITGTNWEGTGVVPDVNVAADRALERAVELARRALGRAASR